jgi:hypothetical protein
MSEDWNNCIMVILLFIVVFIYYSYLKTLLELKRDWRNFKCNPIYMLFSSLGKPKKQSNTDNVERCIKSVFDEKYNQADANIITAQRLYSGTGVPE